MGRLVVSTGGRSFLAIGGELNRWLQSVDACDGLLTIFLRHTSASLTVQENTDPDVQDDILDALDRMAPADGGWRHSLEGEDDMPAHIKTVLTGVSLQVPVVDGRLDLGTWQEVFVIEHRCGPHQRSMTLHYQGT
ncbi:YjbQ family protein [Stappia sp. F7233]|uniref:YjbQ family protein n=2 Tax=Stappia albiluteola TaxID=2758565 RepID=A0A839AJR3_9HYPH|nr:YjbQ family protein [Stappia albiluteola]